MTFVAPGDDADRLAASTYDIRFAFDASDLNERNFYTASPVPLEAVGGGVIEPVPAGDTFSVDLIALELPFGGKETAIGREVFFAVVAKDEEGNASPVSDVVGITVADIYRPNPVELQANDAFALGFSLLFEETGDDFDKGIGKNR